MTPAVNALSLYANIDIFLIVYLFYTRQKNLVFRATVLKTLGRVGSFF